jgi:hypothetical protein
MAIVALVALVLVFVAVAKSANKARTLGIILAWTFGVATGAGFLSFIVALMVGAGNPGAVSGDIAGPAFSLTLLFSSVAQLRGSKRAGDVMELEGSAAVAPPPPPVPSTLDPAKR